MTNEPPLSNIYGPARVFHDKETGITTEWWYINGVEYSAEDHPLNLFAKDNNLTDDYLEWPLEYMFQYETFVAYYTGDYTD